MLIVRLDRTQWRLAKAVEHVAAQILAAGPAALAEEAAKTIRPTKPWVRQAEPAAVARAQAEREIQIALRDGDLHAQGRLSTTAHGEWDLHSGHHSGIAPEQWRAGRADVDHGSLTMADGQFIDIRMPRFMVLAIWPVIAEPGPIPDPATSAPYRTPYMDLLDRAIAANQITERNQGKKELLAEWFRGQQVAGAPVSQNLADAMATLIRLPSSQRGGAKRGS
jgi:hypothetical protein